MKGRLCMASGLDLDAYFARIGWGGGTVPSYHTLAGLVEAHTGNIPFENLDVLLGRDVRLDLEGLQEKLVRRRRGGYCFEHATLFGAVLDEIGFRPARHAARVILMGPPEQSPRAHMFLTVPVEGETFLVDPGFASFSARRPLRLAPVAPGSSQAHHLTQQDGIWTLHIPRDERTIPGWVTTLERENPIDFELSNYWTATHPTSPFRRVMMMSAVTPQGRVNVMNQDVTHVGADGTVRSELKDRGALRALLAEHFGFDLPEAETLIVPAIPDWN
jgi:N-hydroxyarylamine O-acetyltransferase